jgi:predicted anti-sigma-YlaC factor YlaD
MRCEDLNERLADYLGGELGTAARAEVEQHLGTCAACAAEAASLRRTLDALRTLPESTPGEREPQARSRTGARAARGAAMLRYAAAILIAFTLGYVVRDRSAGESREGEGEPAIVQRGGGTAVASTSWPERAAEVYARQSTRSELARSLVALSSVGK